MIFSQQISIFALVLLISRIVTFEDLNLNKPLLQALNDLEFVYPTPIQKQAFSVVMSGRDVVGIAQTGTGKTFAYLLPILRQLTYSEQLEPRALIIVPTRELVVQIEGEIKKLAKYSFIRSAGVYGGGNINTQKQTLYQGVDIVVATPGRLLDIVLHGALSLRSLQKFVIDEVDEMLNLGFRTQLKSLIDILPPRRQNIMFSATLTSDVEAIIDETFNTPEKIVVTPHGTPIEKIVQKVYHVPNFHTKANLLELFLKTDQEMEKVLVFVKSKRMADRLFDIVAGKFPDQIGLIHSDRTQSSRLSAVKNFDNGTHRVLIATDVIARGLDITDVTHVFNFDTPDQSADYIHRIGRTGRADKNGIAITFTSDMEREYKAAIEKLMSRTIDVEVLPVDLVVSPVFLEEEKAPVLFDKHYLKAPSLKNSKGAFHEKKESNKKVNSGSPSKRNAKNPKQKKYQRPKY